METPSIRVESVAEFVKAVEVTVAERRWLFRGQADESWPLWPSLCRMIPVADTIRAAERTMMDEFKRYAQPYLQRTPRDEWQWLALAQHYGVPTRLLDWSSNPLAALFFAVAEPAVTESVVWCYRYTRPQRTDGIDPYGIHDVIVFSPDHDSGRIIGQAGFFTVHPIPLRPFWAREDGQEMLRALIVPCTARVPMRAQLDRMGINYATLFPDLDGVGRHIRWSNSVLQEEKTSRPVFGEPSADATPKAQ